MSNAGARRGIVADFEHPLSIAAAPAPLEQLSSLRRLIGSGSSIVLPEVHCVHYEHHTKRRLSAQAIRGDEF